MYKCWVDGEPCEAVAPIAGLVDEASIETVASSGALPCDVCRQAERDTAELSGLRLGKHERRILLEAGPPSDPARIPGNVKRTHLEPENGTRAAREALRRALRTLHQAGLVYRETEYSRGEGRRWFSAMVDEYGLPIPGSSRYGERHLGVTYITTHRMAARLSPLGGAFMEMARPELQAGARIRWARYQTVIIAAVRKRGPDLLVEFRHWVENERMLAGLMRQSDRAQHAAAVKKALDSIL